MAKYRIKKYEFNYSTQFKVQKRFFFGWWYHVADFTAIKGYYQSLEDAKSFIEGLQKKIEIVWKS